MLRAENKALKLQLSQLQLVLQADVSGRAARARQRGPARRRPAAGAAPGRSAGVAAGPLPARRPPGAVSLPRIASRRARQRHPARLLPRACCRASPRGAAGRRSGASRPPQRPPRRRPHLAGARPSLVPAPQPAATAAVAPLEQADTAAPLASDDPNALYQAIAAGINWPQPGQAGFYDRCGRAPQRRRRGERGAAAAGCGGQSSSSPVEPAAQGAGCRAPVPTRRSSRRSRPPPPLPAPPPPPTPPLPRPARRPARSQPMPVRLSSNDPKPPRDGNPLQVVHITAEMAPLAKVGGLGDVVTGGRSPSPCLCRAWPQGPRCDAARRRARLHLQGPPLSAAVRRARCRRPGAQLPGARPRRAHHAALLRVPQAGAARWMDGWMDGWRWPAGLPALLASCGRAEPPALR